MNSQDVDYRQCTVAERRANCKADSKQFDTIVTAEVERLHTHLQSSNVVPTILRIQENMENVRKAEVNHVRSRLGHLSPEQEGVIDALTHSIIDKVLQDPIYVLKNAAIHNEKTIIIPLVERLFDMPGTTRENHERDQRKRPLRVQRDAQREPDVADTARSGA